MLYFVVRGYQYSDSHEIPTPHYVVSDALVVKVLERQVIHVGKLDSFLLRISFIQV